MAIYLQEDLPYDYSALEPFVSGEIMELHHDKHAAAYTAGANQALEMIEEARDKNALSTINLLSKNYAFNYAGHLNHSAFFKNMAPKNEGLEVFGELKAAILEQFKTFENFKAHFTAVAAGVQGSGWAVLVYDKLGKKLVIMQLFDHQANLALNLEPIILLDCWEHAYYLDYKNVRSDYITAWWNIVNWKDAEERFNTAINNK